MISNAKAKPIHSGERTHHHDHEATTVIPNSLRAINRIVRTPKKPIPLLEDEFPLLIGVLQ
jgi:hypothetical protein